MIIIIRCHIYHPGGMLKQMRVSHSQKSEWANGPLHPCPGLKYPAAAEVALSQILGMIENYLEL